METAYRSGPVCLCLKIQVLPIILQGTNSTGKTGEMAKTKIPVRENTGNLEILPNPQKTQEIWFAQDENSLILKVKDISIFAAKSSKKNV